MFPKHRGDLVEAAVVVAAHARRAHRAHPLPAQPARRARPADRRHVAAIDEWPVDELAALVRRARQLRRAVRRRARARARPARRPLPVARSSPSCARASCGTASTASCAARAARSGWRSPAAAPSPTVACSACSSPTARGSASSTRRWCTRAGRARRSCSAPRRGASRTSPSSGSIVTPAPGPAGEDAVLARRRPGPPARARPGARRVRARDPRSLPDGRRVDRLQDAHGARPAAPPPTCVRTSTSRPRPPASVPDDRTIVVERFRDEIGDWRVCVLVAVRRAGARAVGDGARAPAARSGGASTSS